MTHAHDIEMVDIAGLARVGSHRLRLWFADGLSGEWDFLPKLAARSGPMVRPLLKPDHFNRVMFSPRFLAWPNGFDWCADALYMDMRDAGVLAPHPGPVTSDVVGRLVSLPREVAAIYRAVDALQLAYPGRKFTPDGHLVGSIGEVIARESLGLTLYPASHPGHDAQDADGRQVQIKLTSGSSVALRAICERLLVMRVFDPGFAEIVYFGDFEPVWQACGGLPTNGQRPISLSTLREIGSGSRNDRSFGPV
jgi:hypothetical protein